jgi:hypothetical protein
LFKSRSGYLCLSLILGLPVEIIFYESAILSGCSRGFQNGGSWRRTRRYWLLWCLERQKTSTHTLLPIINNLSLCQGVYFVDNIDIFSGNRGRTEVCVQTHVRLVSPR